MGLPAKQRTSRSKKERASHFALKKISLTKCEKCGAPSMPHRACKKCGTYKGKKV
jgi:large subunit ribosomal protein L32